MFVRTIGFLLAAACVASALAGYSRRPLREAESENGRFELRIKAARGSRSTSGCTAILYDRSGDGERKRWERPLVNEVAPLQAAIRDDGKFVVTLDEYRRGGARNALVIYGERGQLLRHFVITDLLTRDDWQHVKSRRKAVEWLEGAQFRFIDEPEAFELELKWGTVLRVDLKTLRLIGGPGPQDEIPAAILDELSEGGADESNGDGDVTSDDPGDLATADLSDDAARLARAEQMLRQALEHVDRQLPNLSEEARADIEAQLRSQIENITSDLAGGGADQTAEGENASPAEAEQPAVTAEPVEEPPVGTTTNVDEPSPDPAEVVHVPTNAIVPSLAIPQPDPANPVDYLDWLQNTIGPGDDDGALLFKAAMEGAVPFDGDKELFSAALDGDPAALSSPEITAWLDANQAAIDDFHRSGLFPYQGEAIASGDGSLFGIILPDLGKSRELARASVVRGQQLLDAGAPDEAAEQFLNTYASGRRLGEGPFLIERLVGDSVQALSAERLLDLAANPAAESADFSALAEKARAAHRPVAGMAEAIAMEKASLMDSLQRMYEVDPETGAKVLNPRRASQMMALTGDQTGNQLHLMLNPPSYEETVSAANAYYDRLAEAAQLPYAESAQHFQAVEAEQQASSGRNAVLSQLLPAMSRANFVHTRSESLGRASVLVTQLRAYQQVHGRYPDSLDALGDDVISRDPFTGQPFAYRTDGMGFQLYSLGANGADDGGVHDPRGEENDLVFWPRPPRE